MSILVELREAANRSDNVLTTKLLHDAADALAAALMGLTENPTTSAMINANGAWVRAAGKLSAVAPREAGGAT